jgi:hypothetical protein
VPQPDHSPHRQVTSEYKRRSPNRHRIYFALMAAAFANWPIEPRLHPGSAEHLRAWLLEQEEYCVSQHLTDEAHSFSAADFDGRLLASMGTNGGYDIVEFAGNRLVTIHEAGA